MVGFEKDETTHAQGCACYDDDDDDTVTTPLEQRTAEHKQVCVAFPIYIRFNYPTTNRQYNILLYIIYLGV